MYYLYPVLFNDESRFCLYISGGYLHVQCKPGKWHLPDLEIWWWDDAWFVQLTQSSIAWNNALHDDREPRWKE